MEIVKLLAPMILAPMILILLLIVIVNIVIPKTGKEGDEIEIGEELDEVERIKKALKVRRR